MRIAIFHNLPSGGAKRAVYEWTRRLAARHSVAEYCLGTADEAFYGLRPHVHAHEVYPFSPARLFDSPFGRVNQLQRWRDLGKLDRLSRRIAAEIDRSAPDVVFTHPCLVTAVPMVLRHLARPTVHYFHEPIGRAAPWARVLSTSRRPRLDRLDPMLAMYRRRLGRVQADGVRAAGTLLANSAFTQRCMQEAYGRDIDVCPLGVDGEGFRPLPVERERHVLSVGELSPRKGFLFLVEALAHLPRAERPALRLASNVVDPQERLRVERLAAERSVELQVLVGLDRDALAQEYNRAALCVYAPHNEPFGLVPLEAMACGTAVVGVSEAGVLESVVDGRTGSLAPRDPVVFASAVRHLLMNPDLAAEYGRRGREHVMAHWTWERSVAQVERALQAAAA